MRSRLAAAVTRMPARLWDSRTSVARTVEALAMGAAVEAPEPQIDVA